MNLLSILILVAFIWENKEISEVELGLTPLVVSILNDLNIEVEDTKLRFRRADTLSAFPIERASEKFEFSNYLLFTEANGQWCAEEQHLSSNYTRMLDFKENESSTRIGIVGAKEIQQGTLHISLHEYKGTRILLLSQERDDCNVHEFKAVK